jgi:putative ubiquitin-RnfH superfamily antitoxin RatB of RatAB toxin-antitoxin module
MGKLRVEVVFALPRSQDATAVELDPGATVAAAIEASGLLARHPQLRDGMHAVGIHGRVVTPAQPLADGDRVEIYRPLVADPMTARRRRAEKS